MSCWLRLLCVAALVGCGGDDSGGDGDGDGGGDGGADGDGGAAGDAGPTTVTLTTYLSGVPANVALVAGQDGNDDWTALEGEGGVYQMVVESGRYGFAYACGDETNSGVGLLHFAVSETVAVVGGCFGPEWGNVSGSIDVGLEDAFVMVGPQTTDDDSGTYSLSVPQGTWDVAAWRGLFGTVDYVVIERDLAVDASVMKDVVFDTDGEAASALVDVVGASFAQVQSSLFPAGGARGLDFRSTTFNDDEDPPTLYFAPLGLLEEGDVQRARAWVVGREVIQYLREPADLTLTLPPETIITAGEESDSPYARWWVEFADYPEGRFYEATFSQLGPSFAWRVWSARIRAGWFPPTPDHRYEMPDLSDLPGWQAAFEPFPDETVDWTAKAMRSNRDLEGLLLLLDGNATLRTPDGLDGLRTEAGTEYGDF